MKICEGDKDIKKPPTLPLLFLVLFISALGVDSICQCERRGQYTSKRSRVVIGTTGLIPLIVAVGDYESTGLTFECVGIWCGLRYQ